MADGGWVGAEIYARRQAREGETRRIDEGGTQRQPAPGAGALILADRRQLGAALLRVQVSRPAVPPSAEANSTRAIAHDAKPSAARAATRTRLAPGSFT